MDKQIIELRKILHNNPERAFKEINTKRIISEFLKENTNFTVVDKGDYIYAFKESKGNPIAFRCDMDGVVEKGDVVKHLCGHDGHCAIVCALAKKLSTIETDRDVYLIFQPAEENGQGAKICCDLIKEKGINMIIEKKSSNTCQYSLNEELVLNRRDIMKIRKLLSDKKRLFSQLKVGEIFLYGEDDVAFIKVEGHKVNAVNLQNGEFYVFRANNRVIPIDEVTLTTSSGFGIC